MISDIILTGGGEQLHRHQQKVAHLIGRVYRRTVKSVGFTQRLYNHLTEKCTKANCDKKGDYNPTTALGNTKHTWRFISLPQSHADKLMNIDWSVLTGRLCVSLHRPDNANPLPLDNTETQQWHKGVFLHCGCTTVASPNGSFRANVCLQTFHV